MKEIHTPVSLQEALGIKKTTYHALLKSGLPSLKLPRGGTRHYWPDVLDWLLTFRTERGEK